MILAWLCFYDALFAIVVIAAGITSAHFGISTPFFGFQLMLIGFAVAVLGLICGLIAIPMTYFSARRRVALGRAVFGTLVTLIVVAPILSVVSQTRQYPLINDITTDTHSPLAFVKAAELPANRGRDMNYNPQFAAIQNAAEAYKELAPLSMDAHPDDVYKRVEILAGEVPNWQITRNDPQTRTLEGVATSRMFKFKDDFIIHVQPAPDGGSVVQMRSKSRDGKGDLGTNYHRIVSFLAILKTGPRMLPPGAAQVQP
jgi:uncharacterized protein (DUF1499 family)